MVERYPSAIMLKKGTICSSISAPCMLDWFDIDQNDT